MSKYYILDVNRLAEDHFNGIMDAFEEQHGRLDGYTNCFWAVSDDEGEIWKDYYNKDQLKILDLEYLTDELFLAFEDAIDKQHGITIRDWKFNYWFLSLGKDN